MVDASLTQTAASLAARAASATRPAPPLPAPAVLASTTASSLAHASDSATLPRHSASWQLPTTKWWCATPSCQTHAVAALYASQAVLVCSWCVGTMLVSSLSRLVVCVSRPSVSYYQPASHRMASRSPSLSTLPPVQPLSAAVAFSLWPTALLWAPVPGAARQTVCLLCSWMARPPCCLAPL